MIQYSRASTEDHSELPLSAELIDQLCTLNSLLTKPWLLLLCDHLAVLAAVSTTSPQNKDLEFNMLTMFACAHSYNQPHPNVILINPACVQQIQIFF